jgi:hypothetical protein
MNSTQKKEKKNFHVSLSFEGVSLPPFQDILLLGKKCPHGKSGISKCLSLLEPDGFEMIELDHEIVEAMLINKRILKRISSEKVIKILREKVFPYITQGEIIKVDFSVKISFDSMKYIFD